MMTQQMMNHGNTNQLIILCLFFLAEIADNASLSVEETGSSATESTDSIGSLRNSSPENAEKCVMREINRSSDAMSRLSPMVTGTYYCVILTNLALTLQLQNGLKSIFLEQISSVLFHFFSFKA